MKWTNKGHQFDYIGKNFNKDMKVYIYGAGQNGIELMKRMSFADCVEGFVDNDVKKVGNFVNQKKVFSLQEFVMLDKPKHIVIVAQSLPNTAQSLQQLMVFGYIEGKTLFDFHTFLDFYLPIFAYYAYDAIYVPTVSFLMTTLCNLDCKGCLNFNHFNVDRHHYDVERLRKDVDIFFERVDAVGLFHLSGGEPFMYPHFVELIDYIIAKYSNKIYCLGSTTNGTVVPSEELCKALKRAEMKIWLDDYRQNVELSRKKMHLVEEVLKSNQIEYDINEVESWMDIIQEYENEEKDEIIAKCSSCNVPFISLKNGKILGCCYCDYANEAGQIELSAEDSLDLKEQVDKSILMEYVMGYSENGYYSLCKKCRGFSTINQNKIPVAEQYRMDK